ncbi:poly(3-hydroxyalkanoate) synthetase [Pseudaestuariivita atlantica]|uniref:Poly(3-hydroxyalkanoate) synthetase n=2 Tax=Pseudaestuariivita atlantica TaxID=1317121 RepID=A0A0L1JUG7_9RHOB|nr:poly(3-hydroxyalkanoate) synthetase [Pseudaestuariivita atlantica]
MERWVLFLDTLRQRADNMIEHERQGMPPLLHFKHETILDARTFDTPANYALLRITEVGDDCWEDCVDDSKPPVIVIDPRAGHGPGIGGFKRDSEVGMAMHEGHPVYFVMFYPEPMPGQTLADVHHALRRFVEEVARRHPDHPPVLYGNCQAGWAATLLAADCHGLTGPVVLNGSPLSYWAGDAGDNTMRMLGGLSGGNWMAHLVSDLGDGRIDGAWLAQNFENLQPEKAIWEKYAHLFSHVDDERERFLEFERWWNGFYFLSREEIMAITENLFIGNKLESGEMRICDDCTADLRRIHNPLVVFASRGDNITPPEQALGWIPRVYADTAELKAAGQRIVYLINPHVGHLGIFVSASVAQLEHRAILESLDEIEALPPGLYEMKIDNPSGDRDCHKPAFTVTFEPREVSDIATARPVDTLANVAEVSRINETAYDTFMGPWIRAMATPAGAEMMQAMHPMRWTRLMFSERYNPWMRYVRSTADTIRETRTPLAENDPAILAEREALDAIGRSLGAARIGRDEAIAAVFKALYAPGFGLLPTRGA